MRGLSAAVFCSMVLVATTGCSAGDGGSDAGTSGSGGTPAGGATTGGSAGVTAGGSTSGGASTGGIGSGAGGATGGSAGSAGSGGSPPHVVGTCDSLGAVGEWANITPPDVSLDPDFETGAGKNYGTNSFVIDPQNSGILYLGTAAMGIHKSTDCGATWVKVNTGENADTMDHGRQWTFVIDPVDSQVMFTVAGYGTSGVFKTTNGGTDWAQILPPDIASAFIYDGFVARIRMDPTDHLHLTVSPHFTCQGSHADSCMLETTDGGDSWSIIDDTPPAVEGSGHIMLDHDTWFWAQGFGGLWRTSDKGASWANVANSDGYAFDHLYTAPNGTLYIPAAFNLISSSDGISWSKVENSPGTNKVTGNETTIFINSGSCVGSSDQDYFPIQYASVDAPNTWTTLPGPGAGIRTGGGDTQYDLDHHLLYMSNCIGGFWRVVTE